MEWAVVGAWAVILYLARQVDRLGRQVRKLNDRLEAVESARDQD